MTNSILWDKTTTKDNKKEFQLHSEKYNNIWIGSVANKRKNKKEALSNRTDLLEGNSGKV